MDGDRRFAPKPCWDDGRRSEIRPQTPVGAMDEWAEEGVLGCNLKVEEAAEVREAVGQAAEAEGLPEHGLVAGDNGAVEG
jgi:hypothetical protein